MKWGAVYNVYEDDSWLVDSFLSVYDACDKIFFVINDLPWHGERVDNSRMINTINNLPDPNKKVVVELGSWGQTWVGETAQRNAGLDLIKKAGLDYCLVVDGDEIYDTEMLKRMMSYAVSRPQIECWHSVMDTYWKSHEYVIRPREPCKPVIFIKYGNSRFTMIREVNARTRAVMPAEVGYFHHMSYARTDEQLLKKITTFSHASEVVPGWYDNVWSAWDKDKNMINLHPTQPPCYGRAELRSIKDLPPVLQKRFNKQ